VIRRLLVLVLVAATASACGGSTTPPSSTADPVEALGGATWPKDAQAAQAIFDRLPDTIAGLARADAGALQATYGSTAKDRIRIWVDDFGGSECPGLTTPTLLRITIKKAGHFKQERATPDDPSQLRPFAYLLSGSDADGSAAAWASEGSTWIYVVIAPDADAREAALRAMTAAATAPAS
jgi:hypothetical protein